MGASLEPCDRGLLRRDTNPANGRHHRPGAQRSWIGIRSEAGYAGGTKSASSGSFRNARGLTDHPSEGDIIVFRQSNPSNCRARRTCLGKGFQRDALPRLGRQPKQRCRASSVNRKWLPAAGLDLVFHSFPSCRRAEDRGVPTAQLQRKLTRSAIGARAHVSLSAPRFSALPECGVTTRQELRLELSFDGRNTGFS